MSLPETMTRRQVAELFKRGISTIRNWEAFDDDFPRPFKNRAGAILFDKKEILEYWEKNKEEKELDD